MAKKRIQCEKCGGFFQDSKMNSVLRKPNIFMREIMGQKPEKEFYCDECIELVR